MDEARHSANHIACLGLLRIAYSDVMTADKHARGTLKFDPRALRTPLYSVAYSEVLPDVVAVAAAGTKDG